MKFNNVLGVAIFLISPLLALPYILKGVYEQRKFAYVLFAFFWGVMAFLTIPFADLYRHFIMYQHNDNNPYVVTSLLSSDWLNVLMPIIYTVMNKFSLPFDYLRLFEITSSLIMLSTIFRHLMETSSCVYNQKEYFNRFLIFFLFFDFLFTTEGVRFGWALCFFLFGIHLLFNRKSKIAAIVFLLLSPAIHNSFAMFGIASFVLYYLNLKKGIMVAIAIGSSALITFGISFFSSYLGSQGEWYLTNSAGYGNSYGDLTIIGLTMFILLRLTTWPFVRLYLNQAEKSLNGFVWCGFFKAWIILTVACITSLVLFQRSIWVLMALGPFMLIEIEKNGKLSNKIIKSFIIVGLMFSILNATNKHKMVTNSNYYRIALPLPVILSEPYDPIWVDQHVDGNDIIKENHWWTFN